MSLLQDISTNLGTEGYYPSQSDQDAVSALLLRVEGDPAGMTDAELEATKALLAQDPTVSQVGSRARRDLGRLLRHLDAQGQAPAEESTPTAPLGGAVGPGGVGDPAAATEGVNAETTEGPAVEAGEQDDATQAQAGAQNGMGGAE